LAGERNDLVGLRRYAIASPCFHQIPALVEQVTAQIGRSTNGTTHTWPFEAGTGRIGANLTTAPTGSTGVAHLTQDDFAVV
jgi:hypothetical protein